MWKKPKECVGEEFFFSFLPTGGHLTLELQRMSKHSNIIRLRFSRTTWTFFANERSLTPVGLFLAHTLRSQASALRMGAMHAWRYSWNLALTLVMSRRAAKKEAVTWTFNLARSMKDNPSKVSNTFLAAEIWSLFCARHRVLWPQASSDRWRLNWGSIARSYLADLRFVKIVHGKDYMLFVRSLRSLPSSQPIQTAQPHPHCSLRHKEGAGAGSTSSSAVSLTTNDMESRGAQAFATTTDWQSNGVSNRRSTRRLETGDFLGHAQEFV